ncbi:MAG: L,D-transpeptidase family protein [bacterium]|nr:L,D-transpeptidase family protein [bacterium]
MVRKIHTRLMIPENNPHSFDTRGFVFALACLVCVVVLFAGVRYGTEVAADQIISANLENLPETELKLEEIKAKRTMRSVGEVKLLEKLQEYEATLSTRTIGTASADILSLAHEKFIGADLTNMKLYLYENGYAVATYDIASKGKRGSRWETPTGLYKIETKEEDHFSTIGEVHMPYSMQFFGNFFIHGWPYYPGGEPVAEGYSGGCIRLSTEEATKVFEFAARGTPIFVWEGDSGTTTISVSKRALPKVSAQSFLIADISSGKVFAEKDAAEKLPIASLSKLLVALVANETIHFDRTLTISKDDRVQSEGTPGSLLAGDTFTVGDLLYPLIMESNNAVAYALARYEGESMFVQWMNDKARAIGMSDTFIEEPSGLSENNTASARDLFKLMKYIHDSQSFILNVSRTPTKKIIAESGRSYMIGNFNVFAGNPQFLGGKTGYTDEAHETMTAIFEVPIGKEKATVAIIVLGSKDRKADVERLLAWFKSATR